MANNKNLESIGDRTTSEQREITKKGGIASGKFYKDLLTNEITLLQAIGTTDLDNKLKRAKIYDSIYQRIDDLEKLKDSM